ncbi:MAG: hypothetical protein AB1306_01145 [Nitrospirota bacterium]
MKIIDTENLISDHNYLSRIIVAHPFDATLAQKIRQITIRRSERYGIAKENIETDEITGHVILGVGHATCRKADYEALLYHEFGHAADRMSPTFQYSEEQKQALSPTESKCVMEIWNAYINSRLNAVGLYRPSGKICCGTLNGSVQAFPPSTEGALMAHMSILEHEGFSCMRAEEIVQHIWQNPAITLTYTEIIAVVRNALTNKGTEYTPS